MHIACHAALGWTIANLGGADRKLRNYCVIGSVLPDIDAVSILFGMKAYNNYHHTYGHSLILAAVFIFFTICRLHSFKAGILSLLCISSHFITDAYFTRWPVHIFWPFSYYDFIIPGGYHLESAINIYLFYISILIVILLAYIYKRTPMDCLSPSLDSHLIKLFSSKKLECKICRRKCNFTCCICKKPLCLKHSILNTKFQLYCDDCLYKEGS